MNTQKTVTIMNSENTVTANAKQNLTLNAKHVVRKLSIRSPSVSGTLESADSKPAVATRTLHIESRKNSPQLPHKIYNNHYNKYKTDDFDKNESHSHNDSDTARSIERIVGSYETNEIDKAD